MIVTIFGAHRIYANFRECLENALLLTRCHNAALIVKSVPEPTALRLGYRPFY